MTGHIISSAQLDQWDRDMPDQWFAPKSAAPSQTANGRAARIVFLSISIALGLFGKTLDQTHADNSEIAATHLANNITQHRNK